jgi:gluconolactonase
MAEDLSSILESAEPEVLTTGWGRTEGPLWHPGGYATFVDIEESRLLRWDTNGQVSVVRRDTGEGNGCTLDRQGNLIMCEGADNRRITRMDANGTVTAIVDRWQGKRFNKPNDVICRSDGALFFTDPELRLPADQREMGFAGVFRIDPQGEVHLATDQCVYPNGLALSSDESILYVAISRGEDADFGREERGEFCPNRRIEAFDVAADGALSNHRVFCDMSSADPGVPDGMKVDTLGRVYCVGSGGFWVIEPSGEVAGVVRTSEVTRNLAFGGPDNRTLYMTPGSSLWRMQLKTPGIGAF